MAVWLLLALISLSCATADQLSPIGNHLSVLAICIPSTGHMATPISLGEELIRRGHNVSLFTVQLRDTEFPKKVTEKAGITYLHADTNHTFETTRRFMDNYSAATITSWSSLVSAYHSSISMGRYLRDVLQTTWNALDTPSLKNFDLLLATEFTSHVAMCLSKKWRIPLIIVSSTREMFHHQRPPWPFPGYDSKWTENLDFLGRLYFTIFKPLSSWMFAKMISLPDCTERLALGPGVTVPNIVPTVIGFEYPRIISPLTTYTGPILSTVTDPIPGDILEWLDGHPVGSVVYISLGSIISCTHQIASAILDGLSATGYSAVWSLREKNRHVLDGLEVNSKKVLLLDWAPQAAILRHRSIRMAILHGGINGVQEALHSGVPIIVLSFFGEQHGNAARVAYHGLGVELDHKSITGAQVAESIRALDGGDYHVRVNKLRKIFHQAGGVTKAADLVEFYADVGYDHLIPAHALYNWTWIEYYNADVYSLLLLIGGLVSWATFRLCRYVCGKVCRCSRVSNTKTKNE